MNEVTRKVGTFIYKECQNPEPILFHVNEDPCSTTNHQGMAVPARNAPLFRPGDKQETLSS